MESVTHSDDVHPGRVGPPGSGTWTGVSTYRDKSLGRGSVGPDGRTLNP